MGSRTPDLYNAIVALYQLSYGPTKSEAQPLWPRFWFIKRKMHAARRPAEAGALFPNSQLS